MYARTVLGVSSVVAGVVSVMSHDPGVWNTIVAWCLGIAQIAGGVGIIFPQSMRVASIVLGVTYLVFTLESVPGMIAAPAGPGSYVNFFEQLAIVCGAIAVYAITETNASRVSRLRTVARLILGVCALSFAWAQVVYLQYTASLVPTWIPPGQVFWTNLTTVAFGLAGIAMIINVQARLAMRLMSVMIAAFGIIVWVPHIVAKPADLSNWNEISANYLIGAASWLVGEL